MALTLLSLVDILIPALVAILVVLIAKTRRSKKNYPPGPPGRFFFGNFFDFPAAHGYKKYAEWSKTYGALRMHRICAIGAADDERF